MPKEPNPDGGVADIGDTPDGGVATVTEPVDFDVEPPAMDTWSLLKYFGPGILLMMTGVGTSHLITVPTAGGRFGWALLWAIPVAYIFKWYGFRMAYRFTYATGRSILDAMNTTRKKWAIWYVLIITVVQMAIGQAGRLVAAAAVLWFGFTSTGILPFDLWVYATVLGVLSCTILLVGSYKVLEVLIKSILLVVAVAFLGVYLYNPPPASAYMNFFSISMPAEAWLVFAASIGLLPTGIDVTLQASEWGLAKKKGMPKIREQLEEEGAANQFDPFDDPTLDDFTVDYDKLPSNAREYAYRWFRIGVRDFDFGNVVSLLLAIVIMSLSVVWLFPSSVEGEAVIGEIAGIFVNSVGAWMMGLFLLGAFGVTFSTQFNYFDGWPRVTASCCRNLFKGTDELSGIENAPEGANRTWYSELNIWRGAMIFSLIGAIGIIAGIPEPVWLVLIASALAGFIAPVIFFFNFWFCLRAIPEESRFYPARWEIYFTSISLLVFSVLMGLSLLAMFGFIDLLIPGA